MPQPTAFGGFFKTQLFEKIVSYIGENRYTQFGLLGM
jgi:hypothetical protein